MSEANLIKESTLKRLLRRDVKIIKDAKVFEKVYLPSSLIETKNIKANANVKIFMI